MPRVVDVALDPRTGGARDRVYTYLAYPGATAGDGVFAPLSGRESLGFVTTAYEADSAELGFDVAALKECRLIDGLRLPEPTLRMIRGIAEATLSSLATAFSAAVPPGLRERVETRWTLADPHAAARNLVQAEVLRRIREEGHLAEGRGKRPEEEVARAIGALKNAGAIRPVLAVRPMSERKKSETLLRLPPDAAKIERFLREEGLRKPAQALVLTLFQEAERALLSPDEVRAMAGVTDSTIKALVDGGLMERIGAERIEKGAEPPEPNVAQRIAIAALDDAIGRKEPDGFLLFGVTGSGKTEVYLRAIATALREGRQALFLVPEIALAAQAISALRERFGRTVVVLHSDLAAGERLKNWSRAREGSASVVVGARSAVFAPLNNLGVIVVDEEHETSYKQEQAPRYHARDAVRLLAEAHGCPYVLGSATPAVETFRRTEMHGPHPLTLLSLPARVASAKLPTVMVEDLTLGFRDGKPAILSEPLVGLVRDAIGRGEQAILFLNRRAYAPFLVCRDCGHRMPCPRCSVTLSVHRRDGMLRCHQCGHHDRVPDVCPVCHGARLQPFGLGVEKVEEAAREAFPAAVVDRLDRDSASRRGGAEEIVARFRAGETNVLVGTQMVAKGLHFPSVTVVGVVAADVTLNLPDFRAAERTFQLLSQVAGRAGRGTRPGTVIIQTFDPRHAAIDSARRHDPVGFYEETIRERERAGYPPFRRLVNIVLSSESRPAVEAASREAADRLAPLDVLGPADCVLERIADRWRRHLLVKLPAAGDPAPVAAALLGWRPRDVQVVIDVDPYSLL